MKLKYIILLAIVAIAYIAYKRKQKEKAALVETEKIQHGFKYGKVEIPELETKKTDSKDEYWGQPLYGVKYGELETPKKTDSKDDALYTYEKYVEDVMKNPSQYTWGGPVAI